MTTCHTRSPVGVTSRALEYGSATVGQGGDVVMHGAPIGLLDEQGNDASGGRHLQQAQLEVHEDEVPARAAGHAEHRPPEVGVVEGKRMELDQG